MAERFPKRLTCLFLLLGSLLLSLPAIAESEDDPFEGVNRVVFQVNDTLDRTAIKPLAKVYRFIMPDFAERGVRNVFSNLGEIRNFVHNGLQGKLDGSARSAGRFLINTTVGIGGLFDVASDIGIVQAREDLGQTLGVWGLDAGPYLVLPILGPSSLRDSPGVLADPLLSPLTHMPLEWQARVGIGALGGLQTRADLLSAESMLSGDTYILYRQAYLSKREYDVADGRLERDDFIDSDPIGTESDEFTDEEFLSEEF